ncbi:MAG: hypothetical protein ACE37B_04405 [Ilumatobacter sp.]|uniref:hypothetical protein n=1 Tax=Ilumatobacter sp. TaxID=1967498 RepID=UPI00391D9DFA
MRRIASRLLLRFALVAASIAWATFVFTNTIGDPGRGERVARAVLDDPDARAEIIAPISDAVVSTTGLRTDQLPGGPATVDAVVDQVLRDPAGAQAFIDPFAGSWARLLGEDDPRPAEFDLASILDDLDELLAPLGASTATANGAGSEAGSEAEAEIVVPSVPLPRAQLDWMRGVRRTVSASTVPMALLAVGLAAGAFAIGDRRRVTRRVAIWAITAGALWAVIPPLLVWAARSWAPGADAVVAVTIDEATSGLRATALALVVAGGAAVAASWLVPSRRRAAEPSAAARTAEPRAQGATPPAPRPPEQTAVLPTQQPPAQPPPPHTPHQAAHQTPHQAPHGATPSSTAPEPPTDPDSDALWDFYSSR